jgi:hypothetical protein
MTDTRINLREGVHLVRLVESPVETSAIDRRHDYVMAPPPRPITMRPTTNTQFVVTSAIDLRDDVLRDEVPSIVGDACHGVLGPEHDAIVQAIEQEDTQPIRRVASGTTPPAVRAGRAAALLRVAAERGDVATVRELLDDAAAHARSDVRVGAAHESTPHDGVNPHEDVLDRVLARGSSPALDRAVAFARGSSSSLDAAAALACASADVELEKPAAPHEEAAVYFVPMARASRDEVAATRMTMSRTDDGGRSR